MLKRFLDDARRDCAGRQWLPRAVLLLVCGWIFLRHVRDPAYSGIVKGLNLAIHEIGHVLFGFVGTLPGIAGGTILQLAAPAITAWLFYRQRDLFAIAVALCWLGTNFYDVALYAGDARAGNLPLVSLGSGDPEHDWFLLLAELDLLNYDTAIAAFIRALGALTFLTGLTFGAWLIHHMRASRATSVSPETG